MFGAMFSTLEAILLAVGVAFVTAVLMSFLEHRMLCKTFSKESSDGDGRELKLAGKVEIWSFGLLAGGICFLNSMIRVWGCTWLAILPWLLAGAMIAYVCYRWHRDDSVADWLNVVLCLLIIGVIFTLMIASAYLFIAKWTAPVLEAIFMIISWAVLSISSSYILLAFFYCYYREYENEDEEKAKRWRLAGRTTIVLKVLSIILIVVLTIVWTANLYSGQTVSSGGSTKKSTEDSTEASTSDSSYRQYPYFLNRELQQHLSGKNKSEPYYFGYCTDVNEGKDYQYADFLSRSDYDPMFLSAVVMSLEATTGSCLGDDIYYYGYEQKLTVLQKGNAITRILLNDKELFEATRDTVKAFFRNQVTKIEWKKVKNLKNQIYADPYTVGGVPSLILAETDVAEDWCLIFYIEYGKGQTATLAYRHACGWQWVNCAEKIGETPQPTPKSSGDKPTPEPTTSPAVAPTQAPTQTPTYNKDKTKGISDPGNTEQGLDKDTNAGVGSTTSADDKSNNSHYGSYDDYSKGYNNDLADNPANKPGGSSGKSGGKVDSNDDGGASQVDESHPKDNNSDNPAGVYGGPPD